METLTQNANSRGNAGFTLVEVMIVAAIVVILAAFVIPSFTNQVKKSRRADATSSLLALQLEQEKWRANDTDYGTLAELNWSGTESVDGHYTMAVTVNTASDFEITATPVKGGPQYRDDCGTFAMGPDGPVLNGKYADSNCWGQ